MSFAHSLMPEPQPQNDADPVEALERAAERLGLRLVLPDARCLCCTQSAPYACPEHYRRELEPADEVVAELQSIVVAMRHRGESAALHELLADLMRQVALLSQATDPVDRIRHSMAAAAVAVRYREELNQ